METLRISLLIYAAVFYLIGSVWVANYLARKLFGNISSFIIELLTAVLMIMPMYLLAKIISKILVYEDLLELITLLIFT